MLGNYDEKPIASESWRFTCNGAVFEYKNMSFKAAFQKLREWCAIYGWKLTEPTFAYAMIITDSAFWCVDWEQI